MKHIPRGPPGYFSKTNWADRIERVDGKDIFVKKVSSLLKLIGKLKEGQWAKILESASLYARQKKIDAVEILCASLDSSDYELEDGDEDLVAEEGDDDIVDGDNDILME